MFKMRLRYVARDLENFTQSERTLWDKWSSRHKKLADAMQPNDVIVFISKMRNQVWFIFKPTAVARQSVSPANCYSGLKHRITNGAYSEYMLADYAKQKGIELEGVPTFTDHIKRLADRARKRFHST